MHVLLTVVPRKGSISVQCAATAYLKSPAAESCLRVVSNCTQNTTQEKGYMHSGKGPADA